MKRPLLSIFITLFLVILFRRSLILQIAILIIGFLLTRDKFKVIYLVLIGLCLLQLFMIEKKSRAYQELDNYISADVQVRQIGYKNYFTFDGYKVLLKTEDIIEPGVYHVRYQKYEFNRRNPNSFNYEHYVYSKGYVDVVNEAYIDMELIKKNRISLYNYYKWMDEKLESLYCGDDLAFIRALLLGDKKQINKDLYEKYQINGSAHILAISGLHIGLIYGLIYKFQNRFLPRSPLVSLAAVIVYIAFIGFPTSAVRALMMLLLHQIAIRIKRPYDMLQSLFFVMILLMVMNPLCVYDTGLQYSFVAILVIAVLYDGLFKKMNHPIKYLILPLVIQIGMMPLSINQSHIIHLMSFIINLISVSLIGLILNVVILSLIVPLPIILEISKGLIAILNSVNSFFFELTWFRVELPSLDGMVLIVFYLILLLAFEKNFMKVFLISFVMFISLWGIYKLVAVEVYFFDVDQGDGILIDAPNYNMIIDGGKPMDDKYFRTLLLNNGINHLDYVVVSHSDSDHIGGVIDSIDFLKGATLIYKPPNDINEKFKPLLGLERLSVNDLRLLNISGTEITFIPYTSGDSYNNASVVMKVNIYKSSILFTGDIEAEIENEVKARLDKIDILKVPHHGSNTSSTEAFLKQLSPQLAIISVGRNNYGHPHLSVLDRYNSLGIPVKLTQNGCVKIVILPFGYFVKQYN